MDKTKEVLEQATKELSRLGLEEVRFKQDCRKRALDLSKDLIQYEWAAWEKRKEGEQPTIISLANKYYEWLIKEV